VVNVVSGDPADIAGIKPRDIITEIDGKSVESSRNLTQLIADIPVGSKVAITVLRNGRSKNIDVKIAKRDMAENTHEKRGGGPNDRLGLNVSDLTPEIQRRLNLSETKGIIVIGVAPEGKAGKAGLLSGDIIIEVNNEPITSENQFGMLVKEMKQGESIRMLIKRMNTGFLVLNLNK
jgi:serine protease Do